MCKGINQLPNSSAEPLRITPLQKKRPDRGAFFGMLEIFKVPYLYMYQIIKEKMFRRQLLQQWCRGKNLAGTWLAMYLGHKANR